MSESGHSDTPRVDAMRASFEPGWTDTVRYESMRLLAADLERSLADASRALSDGALRTAGVALYKWLLTVPYMEPPMARFTIPNEIWEPFQDALFDTPAEARKAWPMETPK
jgi:hypothetical protein